MPRWWAKAAELSSAGDHHAKKLDASPLVPALLGILSSSWKLFWAFLSMLWLVWWECRGGGVGRSDDRDFGGNWLPLPPTPKGSPLSQRPRQAIYELDGFLQHREQ